MVPARSRFKPDETPLDAAILARVVQRDRRALAVFFEHYYDRIFGHVANLLRDRTQAEDLTQDIFLRLQSTVASLDPGRDPTAWVFTVATNAVRDHWRSAEHRRRSRRVDEERGGLATLAHPDPDVQTALEHDEDLRAVWAALQDLSQDDREVILLRDYEELPTAAVAEMLELKPDAVRQRHSRAVSRLAQRFAERNDQERRQP